MFNLFIRNRDSILVNLILGCDQRSDFSEMKKFEDRHSGFRKRNGNDEHNTFLFSIEFCRIRNPRSYSAKVQLAVLYSDQILPAA